MLFRFSYLTLLSVLYLDRISDFILRTCINTNKFQRERERGGGGGGVEFIIIHTCNIKGTITKSCAVETFHLSIGGYREFVFDPVFISSLSRV
jgi:hypothetical protein